jgi:transglutaminase-like putative cysteine protease
MYCSIRHVTRFRYSSTITQSVMEVRMQPLTEGPQHCLNFSLATNPRAHVLQYKDYLGNIVHYFDIPGQHSQLAIVAESLVHLSAPTALPEALSPHCWSELDQMVQAADCDDWLQPSKFVHPSKLLEGLASDLNVKRRDDPLTLLREINAGISAAFTYSPQTTEVDSPIDHALRDRRGVCQDFSHIMSAMVRELGIPCRYVSGYLFHGTEDNDRSAQDATHAWVEALLPGLGWIGFDPTNNLMAAERHIRVAVGRDYADVPPTKGVFQGDATTELSVAVKVLPSEAPVPEEVSPPMDDQLMIQDQYEQQQQQQQQ